MTEIDIFIYSIVLIPFVSLFSIAFIYFLYYHFREKNNKENIPKYIDIKTEPLKGITPAMAGYIYDKSFSYNWKYLSATIIDMAVKGLIKLEYCKDSNKIINITEGEVDPNEYNEYKYLRALILVLFGEKTKYKEIENKTNKPINGKHAKERNLILNPAKKYLFFIFFIFIMVSNYVSFKELIPLLEITIIITLFIFYYFVKNDHYFLRKEPLKITREDYSDIEKLKDLKIKKTELWTYIILPIIRKEFKNNIQEYYYLDFKKRRPYLYLIFTLTALLFILFIITSAFSQNFYLIIISIIFIITSIIIFILYATISSKRTLKGNNVYIELSAYKKYLSLKKIINPKNTTQELFEKHLPYAIALGLKYEWSNRFKKNSIQIPKWFIVKDKFGNLTNLNISRPDNIAFRLTNKVIFMYDKEIVGRTDSLLELYFRRRFNLE